MTVTSVDVDIAGYQDVYDHYRGHQQDVRRAWLMYATLALRLRPRVRYAGDTRDRLKALVREGSPLLIAANHVRESDPLVLAGAGFSSPLRPRVGHMRVLAKDELFAEPKQRSKIDTLGGIPVFRATDHGVRLGAAAGQRMIEVCAERMAEGDSIAIFPEGTCNGVDPARVQRVSSGIGHIARRAVKAGADVSIVPAGIAYPVGPGRRPTVVFGKPFAVAELGSGTPAEAARLIQAQMQNAVDEAWAQARP